MAINNKKRGKRDRLKLIINIKRKKIANWTHRVKNDGQMSKGHQLRNEMAIVDQSESSFIHSNHTGEPLFANCSAQSDSIWWWRPNLRAWTRWWIVCVLFGVIDFDTTFIYIHTHTHTHLKGFFAYNVLSFYFSSFFYLQSQSLLSSTFGGKFIHINKLSLN